MALSRFLVAALTAALLAAGCGDGEESDTPAACLDRSGVYREALEAAPGEVRLQAETPVSDCLPRDQSSGDLTRTGELMVETATELNAGARRDPGGAATVQLGYLVGAIERGADSIHADLVRRVNSAARFTPDRLLPAEFERTFGRGYSAGLDSG